MTPKEIILLFVDCALELSEKGIKPVVYYNDEVQLIEIYYFTNHEVSSRVKCGFYLDREKPYTKKEVVARLNEFKSALL